MPCYYVSLATNCYNLVQVDKIFNFSFLHHSLPKSGRFQSNQSDLLKKSSSTLHVSVHGTPWLSQGPCIVSFWPLLTFKHDLKINLKLFRRRVVVSSSCVFGIFFCFLASSVSSLLPAFQLFCRIWVPLGSPLGFIWILGLLGVPCGSLGLTRVALRDPQGPLEYFLVDVRVHQDYIGFPLRYLGSLRVFRASYHQVFYSSSWRLKGFSVLFEYKQKLVEFVDQNWLFWKQGFESNSWHSSTFTISIELL